MKGYEVISKIGQIITDEDVIISSNGNISREVFHLVPQPQPQIYLRGSMGLPLSVALGVALSNPDKNVLAFTGDGNFLMGLGSSTTLAFYKPNNLKVLILDNQKYWTTGGQKTVSSVISYKAFFESLNVKNVQSVDITKEDISIEVLDSFVHAKDFAVLHLKIEEGKKKLSNIRWHPKEIALRVKGRLNKP